MKDKYFDKKIIPKPWGHEYVVFRNKKKLNVTYLSIKPNQKTSLHCHYKKKTGFIIVSGQAKIQLGLYQKSSSIFKAPSKLMIRTGLFHQIQNSGSSRLEAFEFENPSDKFDLIRYEDAYGRTNENYEVKNKKNLKKKYDFFKKKSYDYKFEKCSIKISEYKNLEELIKISSNTTIHTILDGEIVNVLKKPVVPLGDIIKTGTLIKIAKKFKVKNKIRVFSVFYK